MRCEQSAQMPPPWRARMRQSGRRYGEVSEGAIGNRGGRGGVCSSMSRSVCVGVRREAQVWSASASARDVACSQDQVQVRGRGHAQRERRQWHWGAWLSLGGGCRFVESAMRNAYRCYLLPRPRRICIGIEYRYCAQAYIDIADTYTYCWWPGGRPDTGTPETSEMTQHMKASCNARQRNRRGHSPQTPRGETPQGGKQPTGEPHPPTHTYTHIRIHT